MDRVGPACLAIKGRFPPTSGGFGGGMKDALRDTDGQAISGPFVTDQDPTQRYTWTGRRRP